MVSGFQPHIEFEFDLERGQSLSVTPDVEIMRCGGAEMNNQAIGR